MTLLTSEIKDAIKNHIKKLEWVGEQSDDEDRRLDARHSLAVMALLSGEEPNQWESILKARLLLN